MSDKTNVETDIGALPPFLNFLANSLWNYNIYIFDKVQQTGYLWMIWFMLFTSECLKLRMCINWKRVCVLKARWLALPSLPPSLTNGQKCRSVCVSHLPP